MVTHILSVFDVRTVCLIKSLCLNHFQLLIKSPIFEDLRTGKGLWLKFFLCTYI